MAICPQCMTELPEEHPGIIAGLLDDKVSWDDLESDNSRYGFPVGKIWSIDGVGEVEMVQKRTRYDGPAYGYGDLPQGTEFDTYIILRVGECFYRKSGAGDSYGDVTWHGPVRPVVQKEKSVTIYEYA